MGTEGGISALIALLRDGTPEAQEKAAGALSNLACNVENQVRIAAEGGIVALLALLRDGTPEAKEQAAGALCHLADEYDEIQVQITEEGLDIICEADEEEG